MRITKNELKYLRSLSVKKFRDEEQKFLLEGWKPLQDALQSGFPIAAIYVLEERDLSVEQQEILSLAVSKQISIQEVSEVELRQITGTVHAQGIVAVVEQKRRPWTAEAIQQAEMIVALDEVSDPGNLGTILRTCDWFGVDAVLLGNGCVSVYNEKVVRSTSGSLFHIPVYEDIVLETVLPDLQSKGFTIFSTVMNGESMAQVTLPGKSILIFGNEAHGIRKTLQQASQHRLSIPRFGSAESLNVGIACAVFLSHWRLMKK